MYTWHSWPNCLAVDRMIDSGFVSTNTVLGGRMVASDLHSTTGQNVNTNGDEESYPTNGGAGHGEGKRNCDRSVLLCLFSSFALLRTPRYPVLVTLSRRVPRVVQAQRIPIAIQRCIGLVRPAQCLRQD